MKLRLQDAGDDADDPVLSLVNLIDANGNTTPLDEVCGLLDLDPQRQEAEALAARPPPVSRTRGARRWFGLR